MKLRKHIRNRRLTDVRQLGIDRIVDFSFGHGDKCIHLILEIYSQVSLPSKFSFDVFVLGKYCFDGSCLFGIDAATNV